MKIYVNGTRPIVYASMHSKKTCYARKGIKVTLRHYEEDGGEWLVEITREGIIIWTFGYWNKAEAVEAFKQEVGLK